MMNKHNEDDDRTEATMACCWNPLSFEHRYSQRIHISPVTQQLNEMSPEERQHVMEEIHGVADKKKQSQAFIEEHLELFELEIGKVKGKERIAYNLAVSMDPFYVQDKEFRLKFLRADEFNVQHAVTKIMIHFNYKLELFGKDYLVKEIKFDDLSNDVQGLVYTGVHQFLRDKDAQGRTILMIFPEFHVPCSWQNFARARWYQYMVAIEEESKSQNGMIGVAICTKGSKCDQGTMNALRLLREALPFRFEAMHVCFIDYGLFSNYLLSMLDTVGRKSQIRMRSHVEDSLVHCLYTLQSFGINPKSVPLGTDERPHKKWFLESLAERKDFERRQIHGNDDEIYKKTVTTKISTAIKPSMIEEESLKGIGIVPTDMDVIMGRGVKFSGNRTLDKIIDLDVASYRKAPTNFDKTIITLNTIKRIQDTGGRFLKKKKKKNQNYEWIIIDNEEARRSISDRFRNKFRL